MKRILFVLAIIATLSTSAQVPLVNDYQTATLATGAYKLVTVTTGATSGRSTNVEGYFLAFSDTSTNSANGPTYVTLPAFFVAMRNGSTTTYPGTSLFPATQTFKMDTTYRSPYIDSVRFHFATKNNIMVRSLTINAADNIADTSNHKYSHLYKWSNPQ